MTDDFIRGLALPPEEEEEAPPPPVPLTFDINWIDPDRSPTMFVGITGSDIRDDVLSLYGDRISHLINMRVVSHVNVWEHEPPR